MRIAVFVWSLKKGGGIQERRADLAQAWLAHGVKADFFVAKLSTTSVLSEGVFKVFSLFGPSGRVFRFSLRRFRECHGIFRNRSYNAILASGPRAGMLAALFNLRDGKNAPLVVSLHNSLEANEGGPRNRLVIATNRLMLRFLAWRVHAFICVSEGVASQLQRLCPNAAVKTHVIHNPLRLDSGYNGKAKFVHPRRFMLGVGRLEHQKGFDLFIEAFSRVPGNDVDLLIIGDGPERCQLETLARERGLPERVIFLGYRRDVLAVMRAADCFVLSSRWEGFGTVLVEALYAQTPIVSFDCPHGPKEILFDGKFGILVPNGDIQALAEGIAICLAKGSGANERWRDFDLEEVAQRYLKVMLGVG